MIRGSTRACVAATRISARPHPCTLPFPYVRECGQGVEDARRQRGQVVFGQVERPGHTIITPSARGRPRARVPTAAHAQRPIRGHVHTTYPRVRARMCGGITHLRTPPPVRSPLPLRTSVRSGRRRRPPATRSGRCRTGRESWTHDHHPVRTWAPTRARTHRRPRTPTHTWTCPCHLSAGARARMCGGITHLRTSPPVHSPLPLRTSVTPARQRRRSRATSSRCTPGQASPGRPCRQRGHPAST